MCLHRRRAPQALVRLVNGSLDLRSEVRVACNPVNEQLSLALLKEVESIKHFRASVTRPEVRCDELRGRGSGHVHV